MAPAAHSEVLATYGLLSSITIVVPRGASSETTLFVSPVNLTGPSPLVERASNTRANSMFFADSCMAGDAMLDISVLEPQHALGLYALARLGTPPLLGAASVRLVGSSSEQTDTRFLLCPLTPEILGQIAHRASAGTWDHRCVLDHGQVVQGLLPLAVTDSLIQKGITALERALTSLQSPGEQPIENISFKILAALGTACTGYAIRPQSSTSPHLVLQWALPVAGSKEGEYPPHPHDAFLGFDWQAISDDSALKERLDADLSVLYDELAPISQKLMKLIVTDLDPKLKDICRGIADSNWQCRGSQLFKDFAGTPNIRNEQPPAYLVHLDLARSGPEL